MKIIDIRKYCKENFRIITKYKNKIYYYKADESNSEFILEIYYYDIDNNREYKIKNMNILTDEFYNGEVKTYENNILFSNINKDKLDIFKVNMDEDKIDKIATIKINQDYYRGINFLGERYLIIYLNESKIDDNDYDIQKELQGFYNKAYLYDIVDAKKYQIYDKRIILGVRDRLEYYKYQKKEYIVFEQAYMEDYEQEQLYKENLKKEDYYQESFEESLNIIDLEIFINEIKKFYKIISFKELHKTQLSGWTRYFSMDENYIYYRTKDFEYNIEKIYCVDKNSLEQKLIHTIEFQKLKDMDIIYDFENRKIYSQRKINDYTLIEGIYNSNIKIELENSSERFDFVMDEQYVLSNYFVEDEESCKYYLVIRDLKNNKKTTYEGISYAIDDIIILYK
ncbi:hypothetical protein WG909_05190 [Peptostreptococcaceae bacterium AGR-M142]